jgi:hypothetical protein
MHFVLTLSPIGLRSLCSGSRRLCGGRKAHGRGQRGCAEEKANWKAKSLIGCEAQPPCTDEGKAGNEARARLDTNKQSPESTIRGAHLKWKPIRVPQKTDLGAQHAGDRRLRLAEE